MKLLYSTLFLVTAAFSYPDYRTSYQSEADTNHSPKLRDAPYVALIHDFTYGMNTFCGGTILTRYWILTAARCVSFGFTRKASNPMNILIRTGVDSYSSNGVKHRVESIHIHDEYTLGSVDGDIALLKLKNPLRFGDDLKPISMIESNNEPKIGDIAQIYGFTIGKTMPLTHVSLKVVEQYLCKKIYYRMNNPSATTFCGDGINPLPYSTILVRDYFSSGNSAVINGKLVGILSEEGDRDYPGIFIDINQYRNWILNHITDLEENEPDDGDDATSLPKIKDVPHMGLMRDDSGGMSSYCGASILTESLILIAARCVYRGTEISSPENISVWTGVDTISSNETMHQVGEIYIHQNYTEGSLDYNLAVLELKNPLQFGANRQPVSINKSHDHPKIGDVLKIYSFPQTLDGKVKSLTSVSMEVVDQYSCQKAYSKMNNLLSSMTFCAVVKNRHTHPQTHNFHLGDSAVLNGKLVGILSLEIIGNNPGIFTNLNHYDWKELKW